MKEKTKVDKVVYFNFGLLFYTELVPYLAMLSDR